MRQVKTGTEGRNPEAENMEKVHRPLIQLILGLMLSQISHIVQTLLPKDSTFHSGLGYPKSITKEVSFRYDHRPN